MNYRVKLLFAFQSMIMTACSTPSEQSSITLSEGTDDAGIIVDVISEARCPIRLGNTMKGCTVSRDVAAAPVASKHVPLKTTLVASRSGNCSTSFNLKLGIKRGDAILAELEFLNGSEASFVLPMGGPLGAFQLVNSGNGWNLARFNRQCVITVAIKGDRPDVTPAVRQQWEAHKSTWVTRLADDTSSRDAFVKLLKFHSAYHLTFEIGQTFTTALTNESFQKMRAEAEKNLDALKIVRDQREDQPAISLEHQVAIDNLIGALESLDAPSTWLNQDGSYKAFADFLMPDDKKLLDEVGALTTEEAREEYEGKLRHFASKMIDDQKEIDEIDALLRRSW